MRTLALATLALIVLAVATACGGHVSGRHAPHLQVRGYARSSSNGSTPVAFLLDVANPAVGETVSTTLGTWSHCPCSYGYVWQRCQSGTCTIILGQNVSTYLVAVADVGYTLRSQVTATNAYGSASQNSAQTGVVRLVPVNSTLPTISGQTTPGKTLTETHGTWAPAPSSYTYQWEQCDSTGASCVNITGATAQTHVFATTDVGQTIRVAETASNANGASAPAASSADTVAPTCNKWASTTGLDSHDGSQASPFLTVSHLVASLTAGQTGCLMTGSYSAGTFGVSGLGGWATTGTSANPIILTSAPGQTATISGGGRYIYIPQGADYVYLENLTIDETSAQSPLPTIVQIDGSHDALIDDYLTNGNSAASCLNIGISNTSTGTVVAGNTFANCGSSSLHTNQDHAIYYQGSSGGTVTNNIFYGWSGWAAHLYPDAQSNTVTHNVMDNGHYGSVIFAGSVSAASNNNTVSQNLITGNSYNSGDYAIGYSWDGATGTGNVASNNCLYGNTGVGDVSSAVGFTSSGNLHADPAYLNAGSHDYRQGGGSGCLSLVGYDTAALLR